MQVAVKEYNFSNLSKEVSDSFLTEVDILRKLRHPNIVGLIAVVRETDIREESLMLVMEIFDDNLEHYLKERFRKDSDCNNGFCNISIDAIVFVALETAKALQYLASKEVAHRDIKPANVLLGFIGIQTISIVKLTDFGVSKIAAGRIASTLVGTFNYMAPEISGCGTYDAFAADMYSFGILLYQLITGDNPIRTFGTKTTFASKLPDKLLKDRSYATLLALYASCMEPPEKRPTADEAVCILSKIKPE